MPSLDKEIVADKRNFPASNESSVSELNILNDIGSAQRKTSKLISNKATFAFQIRRWVTKKYILVRSIQQYRRIRVTYHSSTNFFSHVVPIVLMGRFLGRELIFSYLSNKAESELEDFGRGMIPFLKLFHRIEVTCNYTAQVFQQYGLHTVVVPPTVDKELFQWHQVSQIQPRIVIARRLERENNIAVLIKAFRFVKQKYPRAELIIMGDGPQRKWLEEIVQSERIYGITFLGWVSHSEVAKQFATADLYVNTSTFDGLPLSMLEAFSAGLPIVSTNAGDIPSVIENRVNGLLVPINDYSTIADRIIELIEKPELLAKLSLATRYISLQSSKPPNESSLTQSSES